MNIEELRNRPNWGRLTEMEKRILEMRYNPQHRATLEEVASHLNKIGVEAPFRSLRGLPRTRWTRRGVRLLEQRALDKLAYNG